MNKSLFGLTSLFVLENRKQYYRLFTLVFFVIMACILALFFIFGKVPIWDGDAISQSFPAYVYSSEWLSQSINNSINLGKMEILSWLPSIGYGQDIRNVVSLRPNYLASMLFSKDTMIVYLWVFIFLRFYLTGVAFSEFCFYHKFEKFAVLNGAIAYAFCSYALMFGVRHYFFIDMLFLLPLALLGVERIIRENKGGLLLACVAFAACIYLYFLYIIAVFSIVYFVVRFVTAADRCSWQAFADKCLRCLIWAIAGFCLVMVIVYPDLLFSLESSRLGEAAQTNISSQLAFYFGYYLDFITSVFEAQDLYLGLVLGLPSVVGVCVAFIFSKGKSFSNIKVGFVFVLLCLFVPFASYAINAFSGNGMRWSFVLAFVCSVAVAASLPHLFGAEERSYKWILAVVGVYYLLIIVLSCIGQKISLEGPLLLAVYTVVFLVVGWHGTNYMNIRVRLLLVGLLCVNIVVNAIVLYTPEKNNFFSELHNAATYEQEVYDLSPRYLPAIDGTLYRIDEYTSSFGKAAEHRNYGFRTNTNGVSSYYSLTPGKMKAFYNEMGIQNRLTSFFMLNLGHRTGLNTLNSVKYLVSDTPSMSQIPFGYELLGSTDDFGITENGHTAYVYRNDYYLSYMYMQDTFIERNDYLALNPIEKEQALLQGVVLENYQGTFVQQGSYSSNLKVLLTADQISSQINGTSDTTGISVHNRVIHVSKGGQKVDLIFEATGKSEIFVVLSKIDYTPSFVSGSLVTRTDRIRDRMNRLLWKPPTSSRIIVNNYDTIYLRTGMAQYYEGPCDAVAGVGYHEAPLSKITLTFSEAGDYSFENMIVVENPMQDYALYARELQSRSISSVLVEGNNVSARANIQRRGVLCVNIPYAEGWTACVDGEKRDILVVNTMYMGLELESGTHDISLHYSIRGVREGAAVSILTLCCLVVWGAVRRACGKNKARPNNTSIGKHARIC